MERQVSSAFSSPVIDDNEKLELMYRPPNRTKHINLPEALDEAYNRIDQLEETVIQLVDAIEKLTGVKLS